MAIQYFYFSTKPFKPLKKLWRYLHFLKDFFYKSGKFLHFTSKLFDMKSFYSWITKNPRYNIFTKELYKVFIQRSVGKGESFVTLSKKISIKINAWCKNIGMSQWKKNHTFSHFKRALKWAKILAEHWID